MIVKVVEYGFQMEKNNSVINMSILDLIKCYNLK